MRKAEIKKTEDNKWLVKVDGEYFIGSKIKECIWYLKQFEDVELDEEFFSQIVDIIVKDMSDDIKEELQSNIWYNDYINSHRGMESIYLDITEKGVILTLDCSLSDCKMVVGVYNDFSYYSPDNIELEGSDKINVSRVCSVDRYFDKLL